MSLVVSSSEYCDEARRSLFDMRNTKVLLKTDSLLTIKVDKQVEVCNVNSTYSVKYT